MTRKHSEETKRKIREHVKKTKQERIWEYQKYKDVLTKELLTHLYWGEELTIRQISQITGLVHGTVRKYMILHGIPRRKNSEPHEMGHSGNYYVRKAYIEFHLPKVCALCGSTEQIHIHHKDKNRSNNEMNNLMIICNSCHQKQHPELLEKARRIYSEMAKAKVK